MCDFQRQGPKEADTLLQIASAKAGLLTAEVCIILKMRERAYLVFSRSMAGTQAYAVTQASLALLLLAYCPRDYYVQTHCTFMAQAVTFKEVGDTFLYSPVPCLLILNLNTNMDKQDMLYLGETGRMRRHGSTFLLTQASVKYRIHSS